MSDVKDRALGCFIGLPVGDALGTTLEFSIRDSLPAVTDMVGGGPFRMPPGGWTDDTSMMLALGYSLLKDRSFDAADFMDRCVAWWRKGEYSHTGTCFDTGRTVVNALKRFERNGEAIPTTPNNDPFSAGNGSIMRLAPAVVAHLDDRDAAMRVAVEQSRTTHDHPECLKGCGDLAFILHRLIQGEALDAVLPVGHLRTLTRIEVPSSGYVVHTMLAAMWAVANTTSFKDALLLAVNLGDDSDTVGAVTGQIAGAYYGLSAIPQDWRDKLQWGDRLMELAESLYGLALASGEGTTPVV